MNIRQTIRGASQGIAKSVKGISNMKPGDMFNKFQVGLKQTGRVGKPAIQQPKMQPRMNNRKPPKVTFLKGKKKKGRKKHKMKCKKKHKHTKACM